MLILKEQDGSDERGTPQRIEHHRPDQETL
jgi:hypothetical protein